MAEAVEDAYNTDAERRLVWIVTAAALLFLASVSAYKYREYRRSLIVATASLDEGCLLDRKGCTATLPGGKSATLAVLAHPVIATELIEFELELKGLDSLDVEAFFRDESTQLGPNPVLLTRRSDGYFAGSVTLPVCCTGDSTKWVADIQVATTEGKLSFPFRFHVENPPGGVAAAP